MSFKTLSKKYIKTRAISSDIKEILIKTKMTYLRTAFISY